MKITLYINYSDTDIVNKNINPIISMDGTLRFGTNLDNPIFNIESDFDISDFENIVYDDNIELSYDGDNEIAYYNDNVSILDINYIYVEEFKRFYYVDNINIENNKIFTFYCSVDVLMSLKAQFLLLDAIISRNEFIYDELLDDNKMIYKYINDVTETYIDNGSGEIVFNTAIGNYAYNYLVSSVSYNTSEINASSGSVDGLPVVNSATYGLTRFTTLSVVNNKGIGSITAYLMANDDKASYVKNIIAYPFDIPVGNTKNLYIGDTNVSNAIGSLPFFEPITAYELKNPVSKYYKMGSFELANNTYMDIEPYTTYELYLPYYDYITLKSSDIINSLIEIYYVFEWENGTAKIIVYNRTKNYVITKVNANVGVRIAITRTNQQELADEKAMMELNTTLSTAWGFSDFLIGATGGDMGSMLSGSKSMTNTLLNYQQALANMHLKASVSNNSGNDGLFGIQQIKLKKTKYVKNEPLNYASYFGKPLNQTKKLSELKGYTEIADIHLDNIKANKTEIDKLYTLLTSGIIL